MALFSSAESKKQQPPNASPDMNKLLRRIEQDHPHDHVEPRDYAPPAVRRQPTVDEAVELSIRTVASFGELPTKEIDVIIRETREEIDTLEREAQKIRDNYMRSTTQLTDRIEQLRELVRLSMGTMRTLQEQCGALNQVGTTIRDAKDAIDNKPRRAKQQQPEPPQPPETAVAD